MPGSWSYGTEWRVLGIHSSLLHLNLNLSTFTLVCSPGKETQSFLYSWFAAQMVGSLLGPTEKSCLELPWKIFEPPDCRRTSVQQQGTATIQSSHYTVRMARKSGEFLGFWFLWFCGGGWVLIWFGLFFFFFFIARTTLFWTYLLQW